MSGSTSTRPGSGESVSAHDAGTAGYSLVSAPSRFLLRLFYRRVDVVGAEHVPASGSVIVAANHHNSIVDAMLLLTVIRRPLRTLANAPLFRHPLIGPFLRLIGALPVHRRQEAGDDPARNADLFAATTAALRAGEAILIFPEGRTQPEPVLQELRTGTARMLLAAESEAAGSLRVTLLPVGLVFDRPGTFRDGRALVLIGPPIDTADGVDEPATSRRFARVLTDRLAEGLRAQIVEADDRHTLGLLRLAEEVWRGAHGTSPSADEPARVRWMQRAMNTYRSLRQRSPERIQAFRGDLESFEAELEKSGMATERLSRAYSLGGVWRFAAREGISLVVGAPLAIAGMAVHFLPYRLTTVVVRLIPHGDEEEATDKIAAGLLLFPLAWALEAAAVFAIGGKWALAVFLAAVLPSGFFALTWRDRLSRVRQEAGALVRYLRDRELVSRLRRRRQALAAELSAFVGLAPEAWSSSAALPEPPAGGRSE